MCVRTGPFVKFSHRCSFAFSRSASHLFLVAVFRTTPRRAERLGEATEEKGFHPDYQKNKNSTSNSFLNVSLDNEFFNIACIKDVANTSTQ